MAPRPPASIKVRALQWLAQREHSRPELRAKLLRLLSAARPRQPGAPTEPAADAVAGTADVEVDTLLDWLEARGYLSSQRFVESRIHARQARYGNQRIRAELGRHGLAVGGDTAQALQASEYERALAVWRKKYAGARGAGATAADADPARGDAASRATDAATDPAARARQMRFLAGRGFSPEVIRRVVRGAGDDE